MTSSNIEVNWKTLEAAGIERTAPVSLVLRNNVPFGTILNKVLEQVGGTVELGYTVDDGIISISTRDDLNLHHRDLKVVDIRDLLVPNSTKRPPNLSISQSNAAQLQIGSGAQQGTSNGTNGGGSNGLFGDSSNNQNNNQSNLSIADQRQQVIDRIITTIKSTIDSPSWQENGGKGTVFEHNGQLVINQTIDNQLQIMDLLQQLRESQAISINIEARMLLVSNNFLDDFRFGWDLTIPAGGNYGSINIGNQNTYTNAAPVDTGVPGSIQKLATTPSLNVSATILNNWQLNLLLTATQADERTITVTAPRVTIFNGQGGFLSVVNQQNFVASFAQTVAAGGVVGGSSTGTAITVDTLNTGITLDIIQASVSADRRYVVMTIDPQLSSLQALNTFTIGTTAGTGNNTGNNTSNNTGNNTTAALGAAFVQLPSINVTEVSTKVSIPDGGTLLIGGQKIVGESEIEVGVPILSKIPGLNRLFTNRSFVKDERTLLVLVRPTIMIHSEIESDLFGPNYDRPTGLPSVIGNSPMGTPGPAAPAPGGM
jgi:general secretion pathway protein D